MNIQQLSKMYFNELWNFTQRNDYIMNFNHGDISVTSDKYLKLNIVSTYEDLEKILKNNPDLLKLGASKVNYFRLNNNENIEIIKYIFQNTNEKNFKFIIENLDKVIVVDKSSYYSNAILLQDMFPVLEYIKQNYSEDKVIQALLYLPKLIGQVSKYHNYLKEDIDLIEKLVGREKLHANLLKFVEKRATKINASERSSVETRDILIKFYNNDNEKLNDYIEFLPSIKKYLSTNETDVFADEKMITKTELVDLLKIKSILAIEGWKEDSYKLLLEKFFEVYKKNDNKINRIVTTHYTEGKDKRYLVCNITINEGYELTEDELKKTLISFLKMLKLENIQKSIYELPTKLIETWFNANKLEKNLIINSSNSIKKVIKL